MAEVWGALGQPEQRMDPGDGGDGGVEQFIPLLKICIIYKREEI